MNNSILISILLLVVEKKNKWDKVYSNSKRVLKILLSITKLDNEAPTKDTAIYMKEDRDKQKNFLSLKHFWCHDRQKLTSSE